MKAMLLVLLFAFVAFVGMVAFLSTIPPYDCNQIVEDNLRESCVEEMKTR